jgi:hypothetical protein
MTETLHPVKRRCPQARDERLDPAQAGVLGRYRIGEARRKAAHSRVGASAVNSGRPAPAPFCSSTVHYFGS